MAKAKTKPKKKVFDEKNVLKEMASELDCKVDELSIEESSTTAGFGQGQVYRIELGSKEYYVVENDDVAHDLAVEQVKADLEESPENFNQSFIESHIDMDRLRRTLHSDTYDSNYDRLQDEASRDPSGFFDDAERARMTKVPDQDAEGNWPDEVPDELVDEMAEDQTTDQLKDPMSYLEDIFGREDAVKKGIEWGGIDVDAAADEAVSTDGEGHFLSGYDGNVNNTTSGFVYWRQN